MKKAKPTPAAETLSASQKKSSKKSWMLGILLLLLALGAGSAVYMYDVRAEHSLDIACEWNAITVEFTGRGFTNYAARINAIDSIAVYNAVTAIDHSGPQYHDDLTVTKSASPEAAVATAAHDVLEYFYPASQGDLDDRYDASLKAISKSDTNADRIQQGRIVGAKAAADIIALRQQDGSARTDLFVGSDEVGKWRPTPRTFDPTIAPQWATVIPFVLTSPNQFRPPPPPAIESPQFKAALEEIKSVGAINSQARTEEQTNIAQFWRQNAEMPPNQAARDLAVSRGMKLDDEVRMFALVNMSMADVCIADWDAKMTYTLWRPVTALNADPDGKVTNGYLNWEPLINTPPHPSYVCNHCGVATAGFEVLIKLIGDDDTIDFHTTTKGQAERRIKMSEAIKQVGLSRMYGGIHYRFDSEAGELLGRKVADFVFTRGLVTLTPVDRPTPDR